MTRLLTRIALFGLASGLLAACQSVQPEYAPSAGPRPTVSGAEAPKPSYPTRRPGEAAPRGETATPAPSARVESRPLDALPPAAPAPGAQAYRPEPREAAPHPKERLYIGCAQPVKPGRTSLAPYLSRSAIRSNWFHRAGRGPTMDIFPVKIWKTWGSSSREA